MDLHRKLMLFNSEIYRLHACFRQSEQIDPTRKLTKKWVIVINVLRIDYSTKRQKKKDLY